MPLAVLAAGGCYKWIQLHDAKDKTYKRTGFKILLLVCKALNGLGPKYISNLLLCYELYRPLRLSGTGLLSVTRVKI